MAVDEGKPAIGEFQAPADQPTHSEDGIDLTLIRWMLSLTPAERLQALQQNVRSILRLRGEETET
jgi:hypothetical protein